VPHAAIEAKVRIMIPGHDILGLFPAIITAQR